uniref:PseG/SpsG family protein n=1 Tax=Paraglaciecola sp. TaxID=1920173 RepID=UPI0030F3E0DD
ILQADEPTFLAQYCEQHDVAALVLDGYQFDSEYRQALSQIAVKHIVFDDNNDSGSLCADLVINGASNAQQLGYEKTAPLAQLCVGSTYRLLREEFTHAELKLPWYLRSKLTLVMGGSDPRNLSIKILKQLAQQQFVAKITLATGGAYGHVDKLKQFLAHSSLKVEHLSNCQTMAELFGQSLLAVSAAGGSQFELQAMYTPALLLVIADNQRNATLQAAKQRWCEAIDCESNDNISLICQRLTDLWSKQQQLELMHQNAQLLAPNNGASKVAQCILQLLSAGKS